MSIGGFGWELGPMILGDEALRRAFSRKLTRQDVAPFLAVEGQALVMPVAGQSAVVLGSGSSTDVVKIDERCAVFVRFVEWGDAKLSELSEVSPWWVRDADYTASAEKLEVRGELQLFDLMAQPLAPSEDEEEEAEEAAEEEVADWGAEARGQDFLSVSLEPGAYVVEWARLTVPTGDKLTFVRLRKDGHTPLRPSEVLPVPRVKELAASPEVIERAKELVFVDHGDGGPTVILPNAVRGRWTGITKADGAEESHYDIACDNEEVFEFEGHDAFCLQEVGSTAVVAMPEGLLLPRWVGADSKTGVLAVALQVSYKPVLSDDDEPVFFESKGGRFTLMHASESAGNPEEFDGTSLEFELPAGRYAVEQMDVDGGVEWTGRVTFPDGESEDSMVQAYRFRRV